ncbi:hypothetical protein Gohar_022265, partial [Gossypium harknessii]|nr:hypothetical protein [Gossypium harknessii]
MAISFYTCIATLLFLLSITVRSTEIIRATNNDSESLVAEEKALMETGWWNYYSKIGVHHCTWPGVICSAAGSVIKIYLRGHDLNGSITPKIGAPLKLRYLDLSLNSLTDALPFSIGNLIQLVVLDVSYNEIDSITLHIGKLKSLVHLRLSSNVLVGPIPQEIGRLTNLVTLDLSLNMILGPIPSSLGQLKNLSSLYLTSNKIFGPLPPYLSNLSRLEFFSLYQNKINGSIPSAITNLKRLIVLDLGANNLSGQIPSFL